MKLIAYKIPLARFPHRNDHPLKLHRIKEREKEKFKKTQVRKQECNEFICLEKNESSDTANDAPKSK